MTISDVTWPRSDLTGLRMACVLGALKLQQDCNLQKG